MPERRYGWKPDLPDQRDHLYALTRTPADLPPRVDARGQCPPVYDQGTLGSCTANAIGAALQFERRKRGEAACFVPSRLFIYWCERDLERSVEIDAGAEIRTGIKVVAKRGAPRETTWPYVISKFRKRPPPLAFKEAKDFQALQYRRVPRTVPSLRACLAAGNTVVFGFSVYESFEGAEVARRGVLTMPDPAEKMLGGHAVLAVGYDDERVIDGPGGPRQGALLVRNSWGEAWGEGGYFWMPYDYVLTEHLADDFWTITLVE